MPIRDPNYGMVPETTVRAFRELRGMVQTEFGLYVPRSLLGQPNGVATLDGAGKVVQDPASFLPVTARNAIQSCVVDAQAAPAFLSPGAGRSITLIGPLTVSFSSERREFVETIQDGAWPDLPAAKPITGVTRDGAVATYTCAGHGFSAGTEVTIIGIGQAEYNGTKLITGVPDADHFTCAVSGTPATPGTISGDELAQPTVFLLVDRDPVTGAITYAHTLLPPNDDPVKPATPVADQHWFSPSAYTMERYDGAAWEAKQRLAVGECMMDVVGIVDYACYAPLARYHSDWISASSGQNYQIKHNIGTPTILINQIAKVVDSQQRTRLIQCTFQYDGAGERGALLQDITRKDGILQIGQDGLLSFMNPNGTHAVISAGHIKLMIERGY